MYLKYFINLAARILKTDSRREERSVVKDYSSDEQQRSWQNSPASREEAQK